jgi:long-chain acyl-CoA synthetase
MSHMQLTQGLRRSADLFGDRVAAIMGGRRSTWRDIGSRVARLAAGLLGLGARRGDRIVILALNSDRYIESYYAILWAGCIAVPLNTRWAWAEIAHALSDSEPSLILIDAHFGHLAPELAKTCPVIAMEGTQPDLPCFDTLAGYDPMPDESGSGDDLAMIFYTGGTTGHSKGVMLSHANLVSNFFAQQSILQYPTDTVFLHVAPMFHMADACCLFGMTTIGAAHVALPVFNPAEVVDTIVREQVSAVMLVPTMIAMLVEALQDRKADMSCLRRIFYGASPISEAVLSAAMATFPNARFSQGYGQTELSPVATVLEHEDHLRGYLRSAGRPIPTVDLRVVDETMRDRSYGEVGEIAVRGPGVMMGYWRQPDLTRTTIIDGWLRTGDAGYRDAEGYVFLVDRVKDMIVSGGENVYSVEVENALMSHPAVRQCAVIGVPDERWGEAVHAFVQLHPDGDASADTLIAHTRELIAGYKCPRSFTFREDPLPLSGAGKILKTELRKLVTRQA